MGPPFVWSAPIASASRTTKGGTVRTRQWLAAVLACGFLMVGFACGGDDDGDEAGGGATTTEETASG